ncbi:Hypothetical protein, putative [Bodo saltans]|uniref:Uncharacterized protein n=1 Tax=Bodo saltans TaxID=75058 RepID=A0A0S4JIJ7_BODSA|nr:Hypothetical protein, putative [Bodo saltans]|eukprot:CUG89883.1 Hypothetical protein, putative [Bodo saltans]
MSKPVTRFSIRSCSFHWGKAHAVLLWTFPSVPVTDRNVRMSVSFACFDDARGIGIT